MFKKILNFFKEAAEENARQKQYRLEEKEIEYKENLARVTGRVNLRKRIEEELNQSNCPPEDIVSRFQSTINDAHFRSFTQSSTFDKTRKNYFELSDVFEKEGLDVSLYKNDAMANVFAKAATANALRVPTQDAIKFVKTLVENNTFSKLDNEWGQREDKEQLRNFLSVGLVPLAARVHDNNKVAFFRACESNLFLRIMGEEGNPEDFAAFMYNVFGNMAPYEVDDILSQSDVMVLLPKLSKAEPMIQAFDQIVGSVDSQLAYTFKKYIGYEPLEN